MSRPVTEADLRQPEFRHCDPCDYEFDGDGKLARKDRWEVAMRNIVSILMARGDMRISSRRFELAAVVEAVRELASPLHGDRQGVPAHRLRGCDMIETELATAMCIASCRGDEDRISEAQAELAKLRKIETAAKIACGLLWMTAEWRQGKTEAAYQALLEAVGGSGSQGLRESINAALAAGYEPDAPPGCYWPENT